MKEALEQRLKKAVKEKVFPGCVLGVSIRGARLIIPIGNYTYESGSTNVSETTVYDLASVTKSVATASAVLKLIDEGRLSLEDKVSTIVPEFNEDPFKKEVTLWHLLTYTIELDIPGTTTLAHLPPEEILSKIFNARLLSLVKKYQYTNATAIILGIVAERITGKTLDVLAWDYFYDPLGMTSTTFHPKDTARVAPTEIDPKRGGLLQGVVHDEGAYALSKNRVVGSAGLFGNVPDLLSFMEMLISEGESGSKRFFSRERLTEMHTNQLGSINEFAGLGWEMGRAWMGNHSDPPVFGKSGFTGTMVMADPDKETALVFLSNRVYPKRPSDATAINKVRADVVGIVFS